MSKPTIPPTTVLQFLQAHFSPVIAQFGQITEGEESQAFTFMVANTSYIVRINPSVEGFRKDAYAFLHFNSSVVPIPQVYQIGAFNRDYAFCISKRMPGWTLEDADALTTRRLLASTLQVWKDISKINVTDTQGFGVFDSTGAGQFSSWRGYLLSLLDPKIYDWPVVMAQLEQSAVQQLINAFQLLVPHMPEDRMLVHGDFGSNNILTDGSRITAVLDWDLAKYGDSLFDIATAYFWSPWLDCMQVFAEYCESHLTPLPGYHERIFCYQLWIGLREIHDNVMDGNSEMAEWHYRRSLDILRSHRPAIKP
ncbi:MAG: aminoglycoside phosphotransferase family protein [Chloroflexi bacterium]|nr:aminoglycoside phosphotransferase family protein [Chloroflexota bacterium]